MKKIISIALCLVLCVGMVLACTSCGKKETAEYTVGIIELMEHPALSAATQGFKQALKDQLGDAVKFEVGNAAGEATVCTTIANDLVSKNVDLILGNATPSLQAAYNATTTIPVLGTSITEYGVALSLENFNGTVGGNVSGTSDLAPLDQQAQMILDWFPDAKTVGLLYCSAEPNSAYQVKVVKDYLEERNITVTNYSFTDSNDVAAVCATAAAACDVLYVPTDNTAANCTETIHGAVGTTPIIAGEEGICSGCGVATLSISYYDLGYATGLMAAKILTGKASVSTMPIEYAQTFTKKYNATICQELGLTPPEGYVAIED